MNRTLFKHRYVELQNVISEGIISGESYSKTSAFSQSTVMTHEHLDGKHAFRNTTNMFRYAGNFTRYAFYSSILRTHLKCVLT